MSVTPQPNVDPSILKRAREQINRLAEEVAHYSESELPVGEYFAHFLQRVLAAFPSTAAPGVFPPPAGAIWLRTPKGNLQLQYQINMREVGLDRNETARQGHDELLRQAVMRGVPGLLMPHSGFPGEDGKPGPSNPTDHVILLVPILIDKQVAGLVEVWQDPRHAMDSLRGYLQFLVRMGGLASLYMRNQQLRQMSGQQQLWTQLEAFARQIHASLNPTEVAYLVANEGRRLIACDRICVAVREGKRARIEAVSGADVVERRSNLVRRMRDLFEAVLLWGEKLIYSGTKDDSLPPKVLAALDAYLAESNSKLLIVLPLQDEREAQSKRPPRSALLLESFEPPDSSEQFLARLEVIGKHAAPALYNAVEHRRIPLRMIWGPLATLQEGLGGKARTILTLIGLAFVALIAVLVLVPYPLKMDANGQLLPRDRRWIYTPYPGHVVGFAPDLKPGGLVAKGQEVVLMRSLELGNKIRQLKVEVSKAEHDYNILQRIFNGHVLKAEEQAELARRLVEANATFRAKTEELDQLRRRTNALVQDPDLFWLKAPMSGIVLSSDFRETLFNRFVKEEDQLLRIGYVTPHAANLNEWEIELNIPQKHVGQVLAAFGNDPNKELDVDILLTSEPTRTFRGKLARSKIAPQATVDKNAHDEPEPMVKAWVRVWGPDIPAESQLPADTDRLVSGTEVHARIRCGNRAMGYSLFYGVWEFIYERILFPF
jgi:hypothetical protein